MYFSLNLFGGGSSSPPNLLLRSLARSLYCRADSNEQLFFSIIFFAFHSCKFVLCKSDTVLCFISLSLLWNWRLHRRQANLSQSVSPSSSNERSPSSSDPYPIEAGLAPKAGFSSAL